MARLISRLDDLNRPDAKRALRSPSAWLLLLIVVALGLVADLGTKSWAFRAVADHPVELDRQAILENPTWNPVPYGAKQPLVPGNLLDARLEINRGAVFGLGNNQRWILIGLTTLALTCGLLVFSLLTTNRARLAHVALGLVIAGGLGNVIDRVVFGAVRDFLQLLPNHRLPMGWTWPGSNNPDLAPWVFNVADLLLFAGVILLMVHINRVEARRQAQLADDASPEAEPVLQPVSSR